MRYWVACHYGVSHFWDADRLELDRIERNDAHAYLDRADEVTD